MGSSAVDICSQALDRLGIPPISSFEDNRVAATCGRIYDDLMDSLLARYPWNFTRKYAALTRTNVTPTAQWKFEFQLPGDIVLPGVYAVYRTSAESEPPFKNFEIVNNKKLLTDHPTLFMAYTIRPPESDWPAHFYQLAIYAMTAELAKPLTEDNALFELWRSFTYGTPGEAGSGGYYKTATRIDSQQDPPAQLLEYTLIEARVGDGLPDFR